MNTTRKVICISLVLALAVFCAACKQDVSDQGIVASGETTVEASANIADNSLIIPSEAIGDTNDNKQAEIETQTSPNPEISPSPPPSEVGQTTAAEQTTPSDTQGSEPADIAEDLPTSTTSPAIETSSPPPEPGTSEPPSNEPQTSNSPTPLPTDDEQVVLTIRGDGVSGETTFTLRQLQDMQAGYREYSYSTTNNWPSYGHTEAHGISLPYLLQQAGILSDANSIKFSASDGYYFDVTYNQVFGTKYAFANHGPSGSSGASAVEPIIAWEFGDIGKVREENLRVFVGQSGPQEVNTSAFVSNLFLIEVSTAPRGAWMAPGVSIEDGSAVQPGAELSLMHDDMDNVRIYYTLDGSEPDYDSPVYNRSASHFQPDLIVPLVLTESVTVKAFAAGFGRDASQVATFSYTVN